MERGRHTKAREFFDKCWEITSHGVGFTSRMAIAKAYMGELAVRTDELEAADQHADQAIELAKRADVRRELAHAMMVKGMAAAKRMQWASAESYYGDALRMYDELNARYDLGCAHAAIGGMYLSRNTMPKDHALAREHIEQARRILTELNARSDLDQLPDL
jgi:tetratricopeptide (TPR) repeat protein